MGKENKDVKLTERKIRYIIRAKKRGNSTKRIAEDMKLSPSSVKRVWMHWMKTKIPPNIRDYTHRMRNNQIVLQIHIKEEHETKNQDYRSQSA
jgi:FixJ family two-component response regulator